MIGINLLVSFASLILVSILSGLFFSAWPFSFTSSSAEYKVSLSWEGQITGRAFFIISRDTSSEPRMWVREDYKSAQIFGLDVVHAAGTGFPSTSAVGYPYRSFHEIPTGVVSVQAVLLPYERYDRSDGKTVWLPSFDTFTYSSDQDDYGWANVTSPFGEKPPLTSQGVLFSKPRTLSWPLENDLALDLSQREKKNPARPPETEYNKFVTLRSERLSKFWGRDVNISAWVLLPADFHVRPTTHYPVIINHGHYSYQAFRGWSMSKPEHVEFPRPLSGNPDDCFYCSTTACDDCVLHDSFDQLYAYYFTKNWTSLAKSSAFFGARVLLVRLQSQNPFFDDSYAVNSANLGPYGDALTFELIPEIERLYRGLGPWARGLYGGSTGGWESIAAQVLYPGQFNGCIANAPDPVDFRALQTLNIYQESNAFRKASQFPIGLRPMRRTYKGEVEMTMEQQMLYERALGGWGQLHGWFAIFGPKNDNGYPKPLWDSNGVIDKEVAEYWKENYDISAILDRNWARGIGEMLSGKITVNVGAMDAFALNDAVYRLEQTLTDRVPDAKATFQFGTSRGRGYSHAWSGSNESAMRIVDLTLHQRLVPLLVQGFVDRAPPGADMSWRY